MKQGRLQMRVDEKLLERVKKLARRRGMTLTHLTEALFRRELEADELDKKQALVEAEQI